MVVRRLLVLSACLALGAALGQPASPADPAPSLAVADQVGHAFALLIDGVTLPRAGYVAVYAYDARGRLVEAPLGALALEAGTHTDVAVGLRLATLTRRGYVAGARPMLVRLHEDDGDERFLFREPGMGDLPMTVAGAPVERQVSYRQGEVVQAIDQTLVNGALTVASAFVPQDAFLVVRAVEPGAAGVGTTFGARLVPAGQHAYLRVPLALDALRAGGYDTTPRAVALTVHPDDGDGVFREVGGADGPVMTDVGALRLLPAVALPQEGVPSIASTFELRLELGADGMAVRLTDVTLTQPSFLALHAVDADGGIVDAPVLGRSGRRNAGTHRRVPIAIRDDATPVIGDPVVVLIHLDDGDGRYRFPASDPVAEVDGVPLRYPMTLR